MIRDESRLILARRPDSMKPLLLFAREKATQAGFSGRGLKEVELAVEEMASDAIGHALEPGFGSPYEVVLERRPGRFVIAVEDRSSPFDLEAAKKRREAGLSLLLVRAFADAVRFVNLGAKGKRVEIVKNIPSEDVGRQISEFAAAGEPPQSPAGVEIRQGQAGDCLPLSRLCYEAFGRSDAREFLYFPDRLREMLAARAVEARVAVGPGGEIIDACLASLEDPENPVGVAGPCLEAPGFERTDLTGNLVSSLIEGLRARGAYGLLCENPEEGPRDAFAAFDAAETALLLGHWPPAPRGSGGRKKRPGRRRTVLIEFLRVSEGPAREVYPPFHHAGMIRKIYSKTGLNRVIHEAEARGSREEAAGTSRVDVEVRPSAARATLTVKGFGQDLLDHLYVHLEEFDRHGAEVVHLDLPLEDPASASFSAAAETLGFSFAGIIPELYGGDVLRLQRLNAPPLDPPALRTATEFGTELARYVWGEYRSSAGMLTA
jgi:anti-sigma regulatory factor (Ser/Thr protein kinase)